MVTTNEILKITLPRTLATAISTLPSEGSRRHRSRLTGIEDDELEYEAGATKGGAICWMTPT